MALTEIDSQLLKQCLTQGPRAWQDFVDRFIGLFVHVIQHTAHSRSIRLTGDDVDDLCGEIFYAILANDFAVLRNFRGQSSLATYLSVVARRVTVRELIKRRKAEAMGHVNAHQAALEPNDAEGEEIEELAHLMHQLPPRDAEALRKYHLEGKTYRDIGRELGVEENSVGPMLSRAREQLRRLRWVASA
ncbi:RNA polymerase sigma factor SigY [Caulifigura coniformis]|uniref:RNA polymerase sigma factor SigY n=1 Tax=Caulifigura coniformis TaxID=2527983 RepID=A0A517SAK2_9PLAN|nr:sigma-70 family RNA polymerase sigma factor [Caulifigura coniformis]QDT53165.1 RNA polymerase sigma factor SigY [Caulifigura coniformis]